MPRPYAIEVTVEAEDMASLKDMLRKLSEHDLRTVGFREGDTAFLSYAFTKHPAFEDEN